MMSYKDVDHAIILDLFSKQSQVSFATNGTHVTLVRNQFIANPILSKDSP